MEKEEEGKEEEEEDAPKKEERRRVGGGWSRALVDLARSRPSAAVVPRVNPTAAVARVNPALFQPALPRALNRPPR